MLITKAQLAQLAPRALPVYLAAFEKADEVMARYGITTPLRVAHFMSQLLHESGALTVKEENLSYSAERLMKVWPKRFPTIEIAKKFEKNPRALAEKVYGGRRELGNVNEGDGYRYRGRGLIQLTGRTNYRKRGVRIGAELEVNPDLAIDPAHVLVIAADYWSEHGCNTFADKDDLERVTRAINGGVIGIESRRHLLDRCKEILR